MSTRAPPTPAAPPAVRRRRCSAPPSCWCSSPSPDSPPTSPATADPPPSPLPRSEFVQADFAVDRRRHRPRHRTTLTARCPSPRTPTTRSPSGRQRPWRCGPTTPARTPSPSGSRASPVADPREEVRRLGLGRRARCPTPLLWKEMADQRPVRHRHRERGALPRLVHPGPAGGPRCDHQAYVYAVTVTGKQSIAWNRRGPGGAEDRAITLAVQCRPASLRAGRCPAERRALTPLRKEVTAMGVCDLPLMPGVRHRRRRRLRHRPSRHGRHRCTGWPSRPGELAASGADLAAEGRQRDHRDRPQRRVVPRQLRDCSCPSAWRYRSGRSACS